MRQVLVVAAVAVLTAAAIPPAGAQARTWEQLASANIPSPRYGAAMTFDGDSGRLVMFGGRANQLRNDTWTWDGADWAKAGNPNRGPSARSGAAMTSGSGLGHSVLFGGTASTGPLGDTWVLDNLSWSRRTPASAPSARSGAAMAYDEARGVAVMFGGSGSTGPLGDTWTWNGSTWTRRTVTPAPAPRSGAGMAYDSARGEVVLFGGSGASGPLGDTWAWDGSRWAQRLPTASPTPRSGMGMTFDDAHNQVVLFGGATPVTSQETWVWDGVNWQQLNPPTDPPARRQHVMAYDAANSEVIVFGGRGVDAMNDTWVLRDLPPAEAENFGGGQVSGFAHVDEPGIPVLGEECEPTSFTLEGTAQAVLGSSALAEYVGPVSITGSGNSTEDECTSNAVGTLTVHASGRAPSGSEVECGPLSGQFTRVVSDVTTNLTGQCLINGFSIGKVSFIAKVVFHATKGDGVTTRITEGAFDGTFVVVPN